ncbi:MAG: polymerase delta subunit [Candidatus Parcubacteria bacterium]|jgi:DNA polymerase III delta prime subunit
MNSITNLENIFKEINNTKHHAFLIHTENREEVFHFLEQKIKEKSPNSFFLNLKVFDVKKARYILEEGKIKAEAERFILLSFFSIGREAQNALLKFLEETPENIKIILIAPIGGKILKTVLSRVYRIDSARGEERGKEYDEVYDLAKLFLRSKKLDRMSLAGVQEILAKKDEYAEEEEGKERADREAVERFLLKLEEMIFNIYKKDIIKKNKSRNLTEDLEDLALCIKYIKNNSSSGKTILEYLSLKLPILAIDK